MKCVWLLSVASLVGLIGLGETRSYGGRGHTASSHVSHKPHSEGQKKSGGKPQHSSGHQAPKSHSKPKDSKSEHQSANAGNAHGKAGDPKGQDHQLNHPSELTGGSVAHRTASEHHAHEFHHDRWVHGHHHVWSAEGYWVDAATGLPVPADPVAVGDGSAAIVPAVAATAVSGRPQIHFGVDPMERDSYDAAAQKAGMSRSEWIRSRLNTAVRQEVR